MRIEIAVRVRTDVQWRRLIAIFHQQQKPYRTTIERNTIAESIR